MTAVIVTISGRARSGKDTFAGALKDELSALGVGEVELRSSIDPIRNSMFKMMKDDLGVDYAKHKDADKELDRMVREALAKTKAALDDTMDFTRQYAMGAPVLKKDKGVLIYQVREVINIEKLRQMDSVDIVSVLVERRKPGDHGYATTDRYSAQELVSFDHTIDSKLEDMKLNAMVVARRVSRILKGQDTGSKIQKRLEFGPSLSVFTERFTG